MTPNSPPSKIPIRRFCVYALIGLVFGIIDWYYLNWFPSVIGENIRTSIFLIPVIIFLNYGIWLVPIIPIVIYEIKQSANFRWSILTGIMVWVFAIFGYYLFYTILLSTGSLPHFEHLSLLGPKYETFWIDYWRMFKFIILQQILEWLPVAIIGGGIISALLFWIISQKAKIQKSCFHE